METLLILGIPESFIDKLGFKSRVNSTIWISWFVQNTMKHAKGIIPLPRKSQEGPMKTGL